MSCEVMEGSSVNSASAPTVTLALPAAPSVLTIPPVYLNPLGFIKYDHYGRFPWKGCSRIHPSFRKVTETLAIDIKMVGVSDEFDDDLEVGRVSVVNQHGVCVMELR